MACANLVFPPQKLNSNETHQRDKRGFNAAYYHLIPSVSVAQFTVQIERPWKDSPRTYICCRTEIKTSLALSLKTDCLREFRYYMNESSIIELNCNQIPHVLTF